MIDNDTLSGSDGDDYLEGGKGQDSIDGGSGNDTFFIMGDDESYVTFYGGPGFDKMDYLLYNTTSGALFDDLDGTGHGIAVEFVNLPDKPELTAKDFVVAA